MGEMRLVFDLDDTLYPERAYAIGGFRAAAAHASQQFGVPDLTDRLVALLEAGHLGRSFQMALSDVHPDHTPADLAGLLRAYASHTPQIALFDDAREALAHFAGWPLGLITDGHDKTQARKVAALALAPRFKEIIYTGALGPDRAFHKPHPRAFELMEQRLRQQADDRFVYVGDNPAKDFVAPNAMGWITVMIDRPAHRSQRIHPLGAAPDGGAAQHHLATLSDLSGLVASIR